MNNNSFLTFFNIDFLLPLQKSWTMCVLANDTILKVISMLRSEVLQMGVWLTFQPRAKNIWRYWVGYCSSLGYNPYLPHGTPCITIMLLAMVFSCRVRSGRYGIKNQVSVGTVRRALGDVNTFIVLDTGRRPFFKEGTKSYHAPLGMMLGGFGKADPATVKKLPCTADLP